MVPIPVAVLCGLRSRVGQESYVNLVDTMRRVGRPTAALNFVLTFVVATDAFVSFRRKKLHLYQEEFLHHRQSHPAFLNIQLQHRYPHRKRLNFCQCCAPLDGEIPRLRKLLPALLAAAQMMMPAHIQFYGFEFDQPFAVQVARAQVQAPEVTYKQDPLVEETWALLKKYYIDRTFNKQDWDTVRIKANRQASKQGGFKAASDMANSLGDKYTRLVDADKYTQLSRFDLIGAGVLLAPDDEGRMSVASPPMADSSALKMGLKKGDLVTAINGQSTKGLTSFDIVDLVMADSSPTLRLTTSSPENGDKEVILDRKVASLRNPVSFRVLDTGTGYIRLDEFNALCPIKLREAIESLEKKGADRFILDLRGNPGGTFQTAVKIAGLFMDDSPVTYAADGAGTRTEFRTSGKAITAKKPLVVWIDKQSASASEVLAGALKDNCRALVAGERSFGKALIQGVFGLEDGSGLILTVAKYLTPSGVDINGVGVEPDLFSQLGPSWLGGAVRMTNDMSDADWMRAREKAEKQGPGKLCPAVETKITTTGGGLAERAAAEVSI